MNEILESIVEAHKVTLSTITKLYDDLTQAQKARNLCYFCNGVGHLIQKCPSIPPEFKNSCYRCWESQDHSSSACPYVGEPKIPPWMDMHEYEAFVEKRNKG